MNALESALMRAYLDGELDDEAVQAFEILVLEREDLAEIVEADTALKLGVVEDSRSRSGNHTRHDHGPPRDTRAEPNGPSRPARAARYGKSSDARDRHEGAGRIQGHPRRRAPMFSSLAAAAVVLLGIGFGLRGWIQPNPADLAFGQAVHIEKLRGIGTAQRISLPDTGYLVAYLDISQARPCESGPNIRFVQGGKPIFDRPARLDELGFVWLVVPRSQLAAGPAGVQISCGTEIVADFPVELVDP